MAERAPEIDKAIRIMYTNYRHETSVRTIIPEKIWYGSTPWHPEQQWLLDAVDIEKGEPRSFAVADIDSWQGRVEAMVLNDREIRALLKQGELVLKPFEDELVQPSSVDLRLDSFARVLKPGHEEIDIRSPGEDIYQDIELSDDGYLIPLAGC